MARPEGFEPPTPWFVAMYSIQLSYGRVFYFDHLNRPEWLDLRAAHYSEKLLEVNHS